MEILVATAIGFMTAAGVYLTLRKRTGIKTQNPSEQSRVKAGDRLRMVSMPAEKPAPAAPAEGEGQA